MTKREAKRAVCDAIAQTLEADLAGAGYIYDHENEADAERMSNAARELQDEMERRSGYD